jgi:hypothetical protein
MRLSRFIHTINKSLLIITYTSSTILNILDMYVVQYGHSYEMFQYGNITGMKSINIELE